MLSTLKLLYLVYLGVILVWCGWLYLKVDQALQKHPEIREAEHKDREDRRRGWGGLRTPMPIRRLLRMVMPVMIPIQEPEVRIWVSHHTFAALLFIRSVVAGMVISGVLLICGGW